MAKEPSRRAPRWIATAALLLLVASPLACELARRERPVPPGPERAGRAPRELDVTATAYNSTPEQTQGHPEITASGERLEPGDRSLAVSEDLRALGLAFGSKIWIEGHGGPWRVVDQTGVGHRRIDLHFGKDVEAAKRFGKKRVRIRWEPPGDGAATGRTGGG